MLPHGLLLLRWRRFWRRRAGVGAGRALCLRSFRPHPNPSPKGRGAVQRGKRQQLVFRLRCFAQYVPLCARQRGLLPLRWRRFWRRRAGVGAGRVLCRWSFRCWRWKRERYPLPRPPPLRALTRPAGEGAVLWGLRRFGRVVRRGARRRGLLPLRWWRFCRQWTIRQRGLRTNPAPAPPPWGEGESRRGKRCFLWQACSAPACRRRGFVGVWRGARPFVPGVRRLRAPGGQCVLRGGCARVRRRGLFRRRRGWRLCCGGSIGRAGWPTGRRRRRCRIRCSRRGGIV